MTCPACECDPCDCHGQNDLKSKAVCISLNQKTIWQIKSIQKETGKSKSKIVRDAVDKEFKERKNGKQ